MGIVRKSTVQFLFVTLWFWLIRALVKKMVKILYINNRITKWKMSHTTDVHDLDRSFPFSIFEFVQRHREKCTNLFKTYDKKYNIICKFPRILARAAFNCYSALCKNYFGAPKKKNVRNFFRALSPILEPCAVARVDCT